MERNMKMMKKKRKQQQQNGEEEEPGAVELEDDVLLFHILPRLPVKSLFRFKCVCKKWRRWISRDPNFVREQSQRAMMASTGFIYSAPRSFGLLSTDGTPFHIPDPSLSFLKRSKLRILASCNGLLCVKSLRNSIFVCNPVTKEWSRIIPDDKQKCCIGLAFDPFDSFQVYKLVCVFRTSKLPGRKGVMEFGFRVFSSSTGVWTVSEKNVFLKESPNLRCVAVFVGGVLYWEIYPQIIWFDPQRDLAGVLMQPPQSDTTKSFSISAIGVWKDKLTWTGVVGEDTIHTWILSEFKWMEIFEGNVDDAIQGVGIDHNFLRRWRHYRSLIPYQGGENLYFAVEKDGRYFEVGCYKMKTGEVTKLFGRRHCWHPLILWPYNNSFVRLPKLPKRA